MRLVPLSEKYQYHQQKSRIEREKNYILLFHFAPNFHLKLWLIFLLQKNPYLLLKYVYIYYAFFSHRDEKKLKNILTDGRDWMKWEQFL